MHRKLIRKALFFAAMVKAGPKAVKKIASNPKPYAVFAKKVGIKSASLAVLGVQSALLMASRKLTGTGHGKSHK